MTDSAPDEANARCFACGRSEPRDGCLALRAVRSSIRDHLALELAPRVFGGEDVICRACLAEARARQLIARLERERGELSQLERMVAEKAGAHSSIVRNLEESFEREATFGQRVADGVARVGGSWAFVGVFVAVLVVWMVVNAALLRRDAFDPYPFILLNLVLSCIAALQAPIIMMSQNRAAVRDRRAAEMDFQVNLKAELEIAALHEKIDHLLLSRWEDLVEMQEDQLELLGELVDRKGGRTSPP